MFSTKFLTNKIIPLLVIIYLERSFSVQYGPPISDEEKKMAEKMEKNTTGKPSSTPNIAKSDKSDKSAKASFASRWPNHRIPYKLEHIFNEPERITIAQAMLRIENVSCLSFEYPPEHEMDFVSITKNDKKECNAKIGYEEGHGEHGLNTTPDCLHYGAILHLLMHSLGITHEHQRPDRVQHIKIDWDNVQRENLDQMYRYAFLGDVISVECTDTLTNAQFDVCHQKSYVDVYGGPYDYQSITHLSRNAYAIDPDKDTITPTDTSITKLGGDELTDSDIYKLNKAYSCDYGNCTHCGGHQKGLGGTLNGYKTCKWVLTAPEGSCIQIFFEYFWVYETGDHLTIYKGNEITHTQVHKFNKNNKPEGEVTVDDNHVYIEFKSTEYSTYYATWKAINTTTIGSRKGFRSSKSFSDCCERIKVDAPKEAYISSNDLYKSFLGVYNKTVEKVEDGTTGKQFNVFRSANEQRNWIAREQSKGSEHGPWIMAADPVSPGSSTGLVYFGPEGADCPDEITQTHYYDKEDKTIKAELQNVIIKCI